MGTRFCPAGAQRRCALTPGVQGVEPLPGGVGVSPQQAPRCGAPTIPQMSPYTATAHVLSKYARLHVIVLQWAQLYRASKLNTM